ncbi:MAG: hypothetical protein HOV81_10330 [Kofleriaceae bacterium]|nr:hypothetical protein [Kofleriaceae bacterium]
MRRMGSFCVVFAVAVAGCSTEDDPLAARTYPFGPIDIPGGSEDIGKCVQFTLHNDQPLFVNQIELTTGAGFHHSNWLYVPEHVFPGPDGIFTCDDRSYDQVSAGILGGVFFAQSTQAPHETQTFPEGVALKVPAHSKIVANIHLLNTGDEDLHLEPTMKITPIAEDVVTTLMASVTFEYHPLNLPPQKQSRFSVECDLTERPDQLAAKPDFKLYYALAHYHEWGTGLTIEAVKPTGEAATIYTTKNKVGDVLGGMLDPQFSMAGYTKLRLTCDYFNDQAQTLYYGNGLGEMCIFNAFSDSPYSWAGGALDEDPGVGTDVGGVMSFSRGCQVYAIDATR